MQIFITYAVRTTEKIFPLTYNSRPKKRRTTIFFSKILLLIRAT